MSVSNPRQTVCPPSADAHGTAAVTLCFDARPDRCRRPLDIVLMMDRSYSMDPERMRQARQGAEALIRMLARKNACRLDPGCRMGILSFAGRATQDISLTADIHMLRAGLAGLTPGGATNHAAAFQMAECMLGPASPSRQAVILFTDGLTTDGGDPLPVIRRMKKRGIEIFCVGLLEKLEPLNLWASSPAHAVYTSDPRELACLFRKIGAEFLPAGARDVCIRQKLSPDFVISDAGSPSQGTVRVTGPRTLTWTLERAGTGYESPCLTFRVRHTGCRTGPLPVNQSLTYEDRDGQTLCFPNPVLEISESGCSMPDGPCCPSGCCPENHCCPCCPEPDAGSQAGCPAPDDACCCPENHCCPETGECPWGPEPFSIVVPGCTDGIAADLPPVILSGLGRILRLNLTLKCICPGKRVAVSVILTELGPCCREYPRGIQHHLVPAQRQAGDVSLDCITFALPEALDPRGAETSICNPRRFRAWVIANYVDTDYEDCPICGA